MGRARYTLTREKLLKRNFDEIKYRKLKDNAVSQQKAAEVMTKYIVELNKKIPNSNEN